MVLLSEHGKQMRKASPNGFTIRARWKHTYGMSPKQSKISQTKSLKKETLRTQNFEVFLHF